MKALQRMMAAAALIGAAACVDTNTEPVTGATIHAVNATAQTLRVFVDGQFAIDGVTPGTISLLVVTPGEHLLTYRTADGIETLLTVETSASTVATVYAYPTGAASVGLVALDTAATVAAGKSKVRVVNLSTASGIEVYRTQPDAPTPTLIATPFDYLTASPYLESTAGDWEVYVKDAETGATLVTTDPFTLEGGERRTIFLLDIGNTLVLRVVPE